MHCKRMLIGFVVIVSVWLFILSSSLTLAQTGEQIYDVAACVSMDMSPLVLSQDISIFGYDAKGIMRSNTESKVFDNCTVHVKGVSVNEGQKQTVYCYMKYLDPEGDYVLFLYTQNPGEQAATTKILGGTGKYKGATGGGKAIRVAAGKPVVQGTFQFCNNHKGAFTVPE